jgi:putative ABC transport system ATP-binding protein
MKAFIPQMIQSLYFGALLTFCAGSLVVSSGSFDGCSMVSFVTSLVFSVEPIQVVLYADNKSFSLFFFTFPFMKFITCN